MATEASFTDTQGHWAETAIERWVGYGVVQGKGDGIFDPDANMTRAEMAQMYVTLLNLTEKADISKFTDVPADAWYADAIAKCVAAGILTGTGADTVSPLDTVTREQMFVTFGRALGIAPLSSTDATFADLNQVSDWAKSTIYAMIEAGYVDGTGDNLLEPQAKITRASVVTLLDKTIAGYGFQENTTVKADPENGLVLVVSDGVTVSGTVGDVVVTQGAADGKVTLKGASVNGTVTLSAPDAELRITGNAKVKEVVITAEAENAEVIVDKGSSVESVITEGKGTTVSGQGTVTEVEAAEGSSNVKVTTPGTKVVNNSSEVVTMNKGTVQPGETGTTSKPSTGGGSSVVTTASVESYEQLKAALENANITTITLAADFQLPETIEIPQGKTMTLDLNGHHITVPDAVDNRSIYAIENYGTLTIRDTSADADGSISSRGVQNLAGGTMYMESGTIKSIDSNGGGAAVWNEGTFNMTGGTLAFTGEKQGNSAGAPFNNRPGANATITGGQLVSPLSCIFSSGTLYVKDIAMTSSTDYWMTVKVEAGEAVLENVTIHTTNGGCLENAGGTVTLKGCHFTQSVVGDPVWNSVAVATSTGGSTTVESGTYTGAAAAAYVYNSGGTITIQDGTFASASATVLKADNSTEDWSSDIVVNGGSFAGGYAIGKTNASLAISGGTFNVDPTEYVVDTSVFSKNDNIWTVTPSDKLTTGVTIGGIAGYEHTMFATVQDAYNEISPKVEELAGLGQETATTAEFDAFFTDGGKITWTIYGKQTVDNELLFSFGRQASYYNNERSIVGIEIKGGNDTAELLLNTGIKNLYNWWGENVPTAYLSFRDLTLTQGTSLTQMTFTGGTYGYTYNLSVVDCVINGKIYIYWHNDLDLTVTGCTFNNTLGENGSYALFVQGDFPGTVTFSDNAVDGYTRGVNFQRNQTDFIIERNTFRNNSEVDRAALQLTTAKSFTVRDNVFESSIQSNAIWFHDVFNNAQTLLTGNKIYSAYSVSGYKTEYTNITAYNNDVTPTQCWEKEATGPSDCLLNLTGTSV